MGQVSQRLTGPSAKPMPTADRAKSAQNRQNGRTWAAVCMRFRKPSEKTES